MADVEVAALSYEAALAELDQLIAQLETGRIDLDEALGCYERGTRLAGHCQELLDRTEAKISKLVIGGGGRVEERPYESDPDDPGEADPRPVPSTAQPPRRARSAPVLFPGYEPPDDAPIDPDDIPF